MKFKTNGKFTSRQSFFITTAADQQLCNEVEKKTSLRQKVLVFPSPQSLFHSHCSQANNSAASGTKVHYTTKAQ
jgi:hypothetical protein